VIPTFRTIILCGRQLTLAEQGPVRYSGFELRHPHCRPGLKDRAGSLAFWIWCPPEKRDSWRGTSLVSDVQDHERARLAEGEIIEVRRNWRAPVGLGTEDLARWLWPIYLEECLRQVAFIPEQVARKAMLAMTPEQKAEELWQRRIVL